MWLLTILSYGLRIAILSSLVNKISSDKFSTFYEHLVNEFPFLATASLLYTGA